MTTTTAETGIAMPVIRSVKYEKDALRVDLEDGRVLLVPLAWYPKLAGATKKQLHHCEISPAGYGIHWPDLDEDRSVHGFLYPGRREHFSRRNPI
jgi:hypothetical protein